MQTRFRRDIVEHEVGHELKVGDLIEYPYKKRIWKVIALDGTYVTLEN